MANQLLHLSVMTPEGSVFEGPVEFVVAPASDGEVGILPRHAPLITVLGAGPLRARESGKTHHWLVIGGFLEVLDNKVIVLAHKLDSIDKIDLATAERDLEEARKMSRHRVQSAESSADASGDLLQAARARVNYARRFSGKR